MIIDRFHKSHKVIINHMIEKCLKVIMAVFIIAIGIEASGQELKVLAFSSLMEPMTLPMQRKDNNGNVCALIKIVFPSSAQVSFEGNLIGECEFENYEYRCYLSAGSKYIKIRHPSFKPLMVDFTTLIGSGLKSKGIYELLIGTSLDEEGVTSRTRMQRLTINYTPMTGIIYLNDAQVSEPNDSGYFTTMLPVGTYKYKFLYDEKSSIEGTLKLFVSSPLKIDLTPEVQ